MIVTTAIVQMTGALGRSAENRLRTIRMAEAAISDGARLVVMPELIVSGYTTEHAILAEAAEPVPGPTCEAWHDLAARTNSFIVGGFCERDGDDLFNTAVLIGPDGLLSHYRKLHLFDKEKHVFKPGNKGLEVVVTPIGRIGICVCYDLRFVEVLRWLALQGADIVTVPTAWVGGFDRAARDSNGLIGQANGAAVQANLNQIFVACASQAGAVTGTVFLGSSMIADPYGRIVAGPLDDKSERACLADLDFDFVESAQNRSDLIRPRHDRRTDVYGLNGL